MNVRTIDLDSETLSTRKSVSIGTKEFETPAKALLAGKIKPNTGERVSPLARGVVELYAQVNSAALKNSRTSSWTGLADKLKNRVKLANDDEFVVPFLEYTDTTPLKLKDAKEIAKLQTNYGDILPAPILTPLVKETDNGDGLSNPHVSTIVQNTETFLDAVGQLGIDKPVMAVIPPISPELTNALVEQYAERNVRAYCIDFHRRSPMAQAQLDNVVRPLMQRLISYDIRRESLVYAVNTKETRRVASNRLRPAKVYAYTLGFDIVGDNHIGTNLPPEVIADFDWEGTLRLFDADTVSIVEVSVNDLGSFLPDEAEIPVDRIQNRIASDQETRYRFEKLINAELISIYLEAEGGIDVRDIYQELLDGNHTQDSDIDRVNSLVEDVLDDT